MNITLAGAELLAVQKIPQAKLEKMKTVDVVVRYARDNAVRLRGARDVRELCGRQLPGGLRNSGN
jgi:hypothetical protein